MGVEYIIREMFEEASIRFDSESIKWVVLVDGALNQIKTIKKFARKFKKQITIICDIIHVLSYVWDLVSVLNDADNDRSWVSEKFDLIRHGKSRFVASGMRRSATTRGLTKSVREPIDSGARYLLNHSDYLHYNKYLKLGYPIATGVDFRCLSFFGKRLHYNHRGKMEFVRSRSIIETSFSKNSFRL